MLAVAGAGKTHYICNSLQPEEKNLILAYTHENIRNIKRELIATHGVVPELTNVMTFDSFVYKILLCPYEPTILRFFNREDFISKGITTVTPPVQRIKNSNGNDVTNPYYVKKDKLEHYVTQNKQYYCANISELLMLVKENRVSLIKKAAIGLNIFYDQIMIDEFQDFREHDYELVIALAKEVKNILLVGDYYQHSVSAVNNSGKPFKNGKSELSYSEFKHLLAEMKFDIDETTLKASRRCPKEVCEFVKRKLKIDIVAKNEQCGKVIWLENNIDTVLEDDTIIKLVYQNSSAYSFHAVNWSYSKGDTLDSVCVILTDKFDMLDGNEFSCGRIPKATVNKLYVAMTRTKGNLYLIKSDTFKSVKKRYCK